jgi:hypothetical protein
LPWEGLRCRTGRASDRVRWLLGVSGRDQGWGRRSGEGSYLSWRTSCRHAYIYVARAHFLNFDSSWDFTEVAVGWDGGTHGWCVEVSRMQVDVEFRGEGEAGHTRSGGGGGSLH